MCILGGHSTLYSMLSLHCSDPTLGGHSTLYSMLNLHCSDPTLGGHSTLYSMLSLHCSDPTLGGHSIYIIPLKSAYISQISRKCFQSRNLFHRNLEITTSYPFTSAPPYHQAQNCGIYFRELHFCEQFSKYIAREI